MKNRSFLNTGVHRMTMIGSMSYPKSINLKITHPNHFTSIKNNTRSFCISSKEAFSRARYHSTDEYKKWCLLPELADTLARDLTRVTKKCKTTLKIPVGSMRLNKTKVRLWSLHLATMVFDVADMFGFWGALKYYSSCLYLTRCLVLTSGLFVRTSESDLAE